MRSRWKAWAWAIFYITLLAACGGGGSGSGNGSADGPTLTLDRDAIVVDQPFGVSSAPVRLTATLQLRGTPGNFFITTSVSGVGIRIPQLTLDTTQPRAFIDITSDGIQSVGSYTGTVSIHLCLDIACANEIAGSPYAVTYTLNVLAR